MRRSPHYLLLGVIFSSALLWSEEVIRPEFSPLAIPVRAPALSISEAEIEAHTRPRVARAWAPGSEGAITGLVVDASKRDDVVDFFHCIYPPSEDFQDHHGWTGSIGSCNAGTVSQELHDDTLRRINYYRAMAGLNGNITFNASKNADCQEAALMMAANSALSHNPPSSWTCYTAAGDAAAGASNLSLGFNFPNYGPGCIDGQMEDDGGNNLAVGHRRWLLYSRAQEMGHGSIPITPSNNVAAASIWAIGNFNPLAPAGLEKVAWPPEGFVPHQTVWARWSFGLPNAAAGFGSATVTMSKGGTSIPVTIIHRGTGGLGDPTLVWEPSGANYPNYPSVAPTQDTTFTITVSGVTGVSPTSYSYDVTVINPEVPGDLTLTGPAGPPANSASTYTFTPLDAAVSYETKISEVAAANWTEGAEVGTLGSIVDQTTASLSLTSTSVVRTGSYAFHLAFAELTDQGFEMCRAIIPSASSQLQFHNLRRWATPTSVLYAEVSADGGGTWDEIWSRAGNGSGSSLDWDSSFQSVSASLGAYAGQVLKLRFLYRFLGGSYFSGGGANYGFHLDDITVTNSQILGNESIGMLPAGSSSFSFTPDAAGKEYYLQFRPLFTCHEFGFGEALPVTSTMPLPLVLRAVSFTPFASYMDFRFDVMSGTFSSLTLEASNNMSTWSNATGTLIDHGGGAYTYRISYPALPGSRFYRAAAQP